MENKISSKLIYLDGLRGVASVMVFLLHFILAFLPAMHRGTPEQAHNNIEIWFASNPINIIYDGHFAVYIFFILSGFVLSAGFFIKKDKKYLVKSFFKRYIRLEIPIFVSIFISYLFLKFHIYNNVETSIITFSFDWLKNFWQLEANFINMFKQSFVDVFLKNEYTYNPNLWTMQIELFGSYLVYSFLFVFGRRSIRGFGYIILLIIFYDTFYLAFILGMILSDIYNNNNNKYLHYVNKCKYCGWLFLIIGIILGSFTLINIDHTFYRFLKIDFLSNKYRMIGSFFIVLSVISSYNLQKILSMHIFQFLGKISFSLYLLHLLILGSFSCNLFLYLINIVSYNMSVFIVFISTTIVAIISSWFMYKYVDLFSIKTSAFFVTKLTELLKQIKSIHQ
jgi:peptidoglycan/LPS O-acetylase OafA/YrhL